MGKKTTENMALAWDHIQINKATVVEFPTELKHANVLFLFMFLIEHVVN